MPFGLKNALVVFFIIVIKAFQEYIYKIVVVYFDKWTIYSLLKEHAMSNRLMLKSCIQIQLALNIKKFIGILLGKVVCK